MRVLRRAADDALPTSNELPLSELRDQRGVTLGSYADQDVLRYHLAWVRRCSARHSRE